MMGLKNRINLQLARKLFNDQRQQSRIKLRKVYKLMQARWRTQLIENQFEYLSEPCFDYSD